MDIHKNARLTVHGREWIVRQVMSGQTPKAAALAVGVCPRTIRKWVTRIRKSSAVRWPSELNSVTRSTLGGCMAQNRDGAQSCANRPYAIPAPSRSMPASSRALSGRLLAVALRAGAAACGQ